MKAYLKNGRTIKITQEAANNIAEMKGLQGENKDAPNILVTRNRISDNLYLFIDIDEVVAIR